MITRNLWTKDELILALNLYLKLPFGKLHSRTSEIIHLANLIGRTPSSIAIRLNNFASVDPFHKQRGIGGLPGGAKQVQPIWDEFIDNKSELLFESERILAQREHISIEAKYEEALRGTEHLKGEYKLREVKTRINQNVFREIVLSNYNRKCAITGIDIPDLLVASHIVPWSKNEDERLNPENGICLSSLYDKAYDKGFLTITTNHTIKLSSLLKQNSSSNYRKYYFDPIDGQKILKAQKYLPRKDFLEYHSVHIFKKN